MSSRPRIPVLAAVLFGAIACGGGSGGADTGADGDATDPDIADTHVDATDVPDGSEPEAEDAGPEGGCVLDDDCDDADPCTSDTCDASTGECDHVPLDGDDDGYVAETAPDGVTGCGGNDCDDGDALVYPGSDERRCDEDGDCNGQRDDDNDADGSTAVACGGDDCDDEEPLRHPGASPGCASVADPAADLDCNGLDDDDNDGDGDARIECGGSDCDDTRTDVHDGAAEVCLDGVDQDCDGLVDGPVPMGGDVRITNAPGSSSFPMLLWQGSGFALGWHDDRETGGESEIYFARLDPVGAIIGSEIRVTVATGDSANVAMAWTGSVFGLAWQDQRPGGLTGYDTWFTTLSPEGTTVDPQASVADLPLGNCFETSLAWTGSEFGVGWSGYSALLQSDVWFRRLTASGGEIGSEVRLTDQPTSESAYSVMTWTGSEFVLVWHDNRHGTTAEVYMARVSQSGAMVGSEIRITETAFNSRWPRLAWTGSTLGLAWEDNRAGDSEIFFVLLDPEGGKILSDTQITATSTTSGRPNVVWTGSEFGLAWYTSTGGFLSNDIFMARLDPTGTKIGSDVQVTALSGYRFKPSITWTGSEYGLAWDDMRDANLEIYVNRVGFCD